ncbi:glycosyl transferase [Altererythrobacter sp. B11]|uniref:glycosyltransferase n=1 Tax=Altererythrobacter sp. B11 TaxID=2060312 RepID=UPI000DC73D25|nr:glycosyltransferase [Altererythrobacter sp. B11]BBC72704.1 glycosyl transferase [Altererythrobacter sp. B11]
MKILSIITTFTTGGAEMLVSNLSSMFVAAGHRSHVLALCPAASVGNATASEASQRARVAAGGGTTGVLPVQDRRDLIAGVRVLRAVLQTEQPDLIHAHTVRALLMLRFAGAGVPIVATHHNSRLSFPPILFRLLAPLVSAYVAISDDCQQLLASAGAGRIVKIVNATGPGFLADGPRQTSRRPATILAVGALTDQKNYPMMIEAAALARLHCSGDLFSLHIAGGGAARAALQARIDRLHANRFVKLLGACDDIDRRLQSADLFVNTSHYEGLPIAMLEALQSGLPVLATDVAGTRELICHGENGMLVAPGDARLFAETLCRMLALRPDAYARMSAAALDTGRRYRIEDCALAHLDLYERLVARQPLVA